VTRVTTTARPDAPSTTDPAPRTVRSNRATRSFKPWPGLAGHGQRMPLPHVRTGVGLRHGITGEGEPLLPVTGTSGHLERPEDLLRAVTDVLAEHPVED
jgi:hypothetical protein